MKIILISDTHNQHGGLELPEGDMIIHAGDVSSRGVKSEVENFLTWYSSLSYKYKIFIAGNHDFFFEDRTREIINEIIPDNVIYLDDELVIIEGIKIWGSPVQPWFHNWAFNRQRGVDIKKHWDLIPSDIDILITHGPAYKILDKVKYGNDFVGCEDLLEKINEIKPKIFVCGHIHEAYGKMQIGNTMCYNASVLDERYKLVNKPFVIEI